ncbi:MAG: hypothetical protein U0X92_14515 [Anaerolineales bacterium]
MSRQPLFAGLVVDRSGRAAETAFIGDEPCYVVDDYGFRRHIPPSRWIARCAESNGGDDERQ